MRIVLALIFALMAAAAAAQSTARPRPPGTAPLEEPPPPPPMVATDPALEPNITVRTENDQTNQEYRVKGKLFMTRVTPKHGRPYVMIDHKGDGQFVRSMDNLDSGVRVPQWVLAEF